MSIWTERLENKNANISGEGSNPPLNPLLSFPFDVRQDITSQYYETGKTSLTQKYFEDIPEQRNVMEFIQEIYFFAVRKKNHMLAWNIMVVVSQLPYKRLGNQASVLALAATRNKHLDIVEIAIRCFENWEDRHACVFLANSSFEERWLQDYAAEVCEYVMEEDSTNVLPKKGYSWEMAKRELFASGNFEGYRSRYCSI